MAVLPLPSNVGVLIMLLILQEQSKGTKMVYNFPSMEL
jgi:hypothetical protein